MPIQLKFKLQRVSKGIRYDKNLDDNTTDWMTWWYCGLYKNKQADSQPNVLVAFRKLSDGLLSDDVILKRLPLTALGQFRLGTVWRDGMCRTDAMFKPYNFHVDFSEGAWTHSSFFEAASAEESPPFELDQYPLPYDKDKNWFIEFPRPTGGKLIIPCIEFFSRCFGKSAELKRVLATYPWEGEKGDLNSRLWLPTGEEEEPDKWMVKLAPRLAKDDAVFVAHAKYCPHAKRVAKGIYSQLETQYDSQNKNPAFLKTQPWFEGPATLVASGLWLKDKQSFLALRIIGCSDPKGVPIIRDRVKTDNDYADDGGGAKDRLSIPGRTLSKHPDIIDMTGYDEPDHEADKIEIQDPDFVVPGERRVVIDSKRYRTELASGVRRKGTEPSEFSCGEPYGISCC
ncbi:MAG: hypothetical protein OEV91_09385, partial [Desulfobulbaceae bacterium]|nr:hypothetical protein [Desulfobulbaceae bacterium]